MSLLKKRVFKILIILLVLFTFVGCSSTDVIVDYTGKEYKISYIKDGELLDLEPSKYISGEEVTLPELNVSGFEGWFINSNFSGSKIETISKNSYGNKIFYAKVNSLKEEYTITYYNGSEVLNLNPSKYTEGDSFNLPIPTLELSDGSKFVGWYSDKLFLNLVTLISSSDKGDKVFYARYEKNNPVINPIDAENAKRLNDVRSEVNNGKGITRGMPSIGDVKILVIPVDFTDYKASVSMQTDLEKALFGTSYDTGWESLSTYYSKASYGKLNITGTVTDVYSTGKKSSYYDNQKDNDGINEIIHNALAYFDDTIDYNDYDSDKDGLIDSIYVIYSAPIDYDNDDSIWWAFTDEYLTEDYDYFDGIEADFFFFAGYEFLYEKPASGVKLTYNTETFIHETGHLLGLDDYYDYDTSDRINRGGLGGGDMMDCNIGDHNAYSKTILGWITPTIFDINRKGSEAVEFDLESFGKSGNAIIISKNFENSFYSEYYILDFYTPDGLNSMEAGNNGLFSKSGIVIYHISSQLTTKDIDSVWDITEYNNAGSKYKLIKLVEADGRNDIDNEKYSSNSDLFLEGKIINNLKWNDGTSVGVSITIKSITTDKATIVIK